MRQLFLASSSPRRAELLRQIGVPFTFLNLPGLDESVYAYEPPVDYVRRLARAKACAGRDSLRAQSPSLAASAVVLGADTSVVLDDSILGKPRCAEDAKNMLRRLSGREHRVLSAVSIYYEEQASVAMSDTVVRFQDLTDVLIDQYLATGEAFDKAGSYGIQGFGAVLVESIQGSYSGVVGLPLTETMALLSAAGIPVWQAVDSQVSRAGEEKQ